MKNAFLIFLSFSLWACKQFNGSGENKMSATDTQNVQQVGEFEHAAYFASGCFWCVEAIFESVEGVHEAISGYSGGEEKKPTYSEVSAGRTGHAEAVKVLYDPEKVDYKTLVKVYYGSHNPTTANGQAPDFGRQYRSVIFYQNTKEKEVATAYRDSLANSTLYEKPLATEIVSFERFWPAEDYHQDYEKKNPDNPYVRKVSVPRLNRFKAKYPELLKEDAKL